MIDFGLMLHFLSFDHENYANIFKSHSVALHYDEIWLWNRDRAKDAEFLLLANL